MRGFLFGIAMLVAFSLTVLAARPGGLRRQLRFAARRFRIVLVLGGVFVFGSLVIRLFFQSGPVLDYGPPVLALVLAVAFMVAARDPDDSREPTSSRTRQP
jgi:hypothetical protein